MINWTSMERIRATWRGPLGIKGILHPDDAVKAVELGFDTIVVSNHGGRQLDAAPSPIDMLPEIRAAVGDAVELVVDSGVRRGSDLVIARCLGAGFAVFGRPTLYGVAAAGEAGARRALQIMRNEIDMVMAQIGCTSFEALHAGYLRCDGRAFVPPAPPASSPAPIAVPRTAPSPTRLETLRP